MEGVLNDLDEPITTNTNNLSSNNTNTLTAFDIHQGSSRDEYASFAPYQHQQQHDHLQHQQHDSHDIGFMKLYAEEVQDRAVAHESMARVGYGVAET